MKYVVIFILLAWPYTLDARRNGSSQTSCYDHIIRHSTVLQTYTTEICTSNPQCSDVILSVSCPEQDCMDVCCGDLEGNPPTLYINCSYMFSFTPTTNLGFLLQAREINESQRDDPMFISSSTIIGTWDSGQDHQQLMCRSSSSSTGEYLPNSVTHNGTYRTDDPNAPSSINMTWSASTTSPDSYEEKDYIFLAFFYTIARDVSTNFFPYTTRDLVFKLTIKPDVEEPTTREQINEKEDTTKEPKEIDATNLVGGTSGTEPGLAAPMLLVLALSLLVKVI